MITVTFRKADGAAKMILDAAEFQQYLRTECGVKVEDGWFLNRPYTPLADISGSNCTITPRALLKVQDGPVEYNLAEFFSNPPSLDALRKLARSVSTVAQEIVEHYRPVEISVRVVGKRQAAAADGEV